jgi:YlmC/YmxH family sporulation protein
MLARMLYTDIQNKDVINVLDGSLMGSVVDLEIEPNSGQIFSIWIKSYCNVLNIFNKGDRVNLAWDQIVKIGEDVIIVNYPYATD